MDNLSSELAAKIRSARVQANLSQVELAAELGCSERSLQEWEAARSFPQPRWRRRISAWLEQVQEAAA